MTRLFELNTPLRSCTAVASQPRSNYAPGRCHRCMQRRATMPRVPPEEPPARGVLNLELEDEKESDRHRRRQQQSRDDPGAKACEATCVCCVGLLFFQVAWIVYTYGLDGTVGLLMAPEAPLRASGHVSSYRAASPPPGYGERVVVVQDDAARTQRIHYSTDGARERGMQHVTCGIRTSRQAPRGRARGVVRRRGAQHTVVVLLSNAGVGGALSTAANMFCVSVG